MCGGGGGEGGGGSSPLPPLPLIWASLHPLRRSAPVIILTVHALLLDFFIVIKIKAISNRYTFGMQEEK